MKTSKTKLVIYTILSVILAGIGVCHIPILAACNVDVFSLRGLFLITFIPITAVFCIPLSICVNKLLKLKEQNGKQSKS